MITHNQHYATKVYDKVVLLTEKEKEVQNKYGSLAHRLPILVNTAGLAQALAFAEARISDVELLEHLAEVVGKEDKDALLADSRRAELEEYIMLTTEVMAALTWFKRFSQSVLKVEPGDNANDGGEL